MKKLTYKQLQPFVGYKVKCKVRCYSYHEHLTTKEGIMQEIGDEIGIMSNELYTEIYEAELLEKKTGLNLVKNLFV